VRSVGGACRAALAGDGIFYRASVVRRRVRRAAVDAMEFRRFVDGPHAIGPVVDALKLSIQ